uniref:phage tail tube protein n=1 Tax=Klebsiella sp. TaxID=576 RepID=UPI002588D0A9|nr:phage tail tube protein [Klebsiella sp.]
MAMDIFSGSNLKVSVGTVGATVATDFKEIPSIATFTTSGFESTVIDVVVFNSSYNRKLLGTKSIPDIELSVNWIPDNEVHQQMETIADAQSRCQVKIEYFTDSTHTSGYFVVYNAFVSTASVSGDKDEVIKKAFNLAVDGGPVDYGISE